MATAAYIHSMDLPVHHESIMSEHITNSARWTLLEIGLMRKYLDLGDLRADKQPVIDVAPPRHDIRDCAFRETFRAIFAVLYEYCASGGCDNYETSPPFASPRSLTHTPRLFYSCRQRSRKELPLYDTRFAWRTRSYGDFHYSTIKVHMR